MVGLLLVLLLVLLATRTLLVAMGLAFATMEAQDLSQRALRAETLLDQEWRAGRPGADQGPVQADSVRLRAFRGVGLPCPQRSVRADRVRVAYRGDRQPNPAKDSVLVVNEDGQWQVAALVAVQAATGCTLPPSWAGVAQEWVVSSPVRSVALVRLFESGSYSLGAGALRYRVGRGGRQPVVGNHFDSASWLRVGPVAGSVRLHLEQPRSAYTAGRSATRTLWPRRSLQ